jgi:hypothetical protein
MHKGNIFENPNIYNSPYFKFLSKCFQKFANKIMELLYVNKVHCYFEIFQKILNSQIVPKIAKWI